MSKGLKITIVSISIFLILIMSFFIIYFCWPWNRTFFNNADKEFSIPGLDSKFVPQGMTKIGGGGEIIVSGYMSDGSPSRFYVLDSESKEVKKFFTLDLDGKSYNGHAGGVAALGNFIWTASTMEDGNGYVFQFLLSDVNNVESGYEVIVRNSFKTLNTADCLFVHDQTLWVGEFYKNGKYETQENHKIITRSGETNPALALGFAINPSYGVDVSNYNATPTKAMSIRGLCQGIETTEDGHLIMSTSYSIPDSKLYYYENVLESDHHSTIDIGLYKGIKLWYLDNDALISTKNAPSMTEEMFIENNRVYILFESACKKYKLFNRKRMSNVYSLPINYFEK